MGVAGLAALFVALRWNNFSAPLTRDEGDYAYSARLLIQGLPPYEYTFFQKPPLVIYSYALSNLLLPHVFWSARLLACLFVGLATILLGCIARWEFGGGVALPAMWLMTPMVLLPGIEQFSSSVEMFLLLPLLGTIAIYCHSRQGASQPGHWFAAAFLGVTALLYKYTALPVLAFAFAAWMIEMRLTKADRFWRCLASAAVGALAAAALEVGYFFIRGGGAGFWECTVSFNRYYVASGPFGLTSLMANLKLFWHGWWILFFLPWVGLLWPNRRIWFWWGIFLCALLATGLSTYEQYYIPLIPFWALLSAVGLRALASRLKMRSAPPVWSGPLLTAVVVILLMLPDVRWLLCAPERFARVKMEGYPFVGSQWIAARVSALTAPDDFVFIAGSEPQILYYAQRFNPTRFTTLYPLMIPSPAAQRYQQEAIRDLQKRPPALIVFVKTPNSWARHPGTPPDFLDFLGYFVSHNYHLVGGYVNDENKRLGELTADEMASADVLLYERNDHQMRKGPVP